MNQASIDKLLQQAIESHKNGDLAQADKHYKEILSLNPAHHEALHYSGLVARQQERMQDAIELLQRAIKSDPADAMCLCNLGNLLSEQGELLQAIDVYRKALSVKPDYVDAQYNLANTLKAAEDYNGARDAYQRLLAIAPQDADGWMGLGSSLLFLQRNEDAVTAYKKAVEIASAEPLTHFDLGIAQFKANDLNAALKSIRQAIKLKPDFPDAHNELAKILYTQGKFEQSIASCSEALRLRPGYISAQDNLAKFYLAAAKQSKARKANVRRAEKHNELANLFIKLGKPEAALAASQEAVRNNPSLASAYNYLGISLSNNNQFEDAIAAYKKALHLKPEYADVCNNMGFTYSTMGRFEDALQWYNRALELDPDMGGACLNIARAKRFTSHDTTEIRQIEKLLEKPDLSIQSQTATHFALGKIYQDCEEPDRAFDHYAKANQLKRKSIQHNPEEHTVRISAIIDIFTTDFFKQFSDYGDDSDIPVFILGMPRSGTTLVEQILASHPMVHGAGEQTMIGKTAGGLQKALNTIKPYPFCITLLQPDKALRLAENYLLKLTSKAPSATRITDKMPMNFLHLGLITLLFPRARIIHCVRNPVDTCLSNYIQLFAEGHEFSYDQQELGLFYGNYHRLMKHWNSVLPLQMHEVVYENLVSNQEPEIRKLLEHCDLPWDEKCLNFHHHERSVQTASQWQVRQPVYSSSVKRWKKYERHLAPLKQTLLQQGVTIE